LWEDYLIGNTHTRFYIYTDFLHRFLIATVVISIDGFPVIQSSAMLFMSLLKLTALFKTRGSKIFKEASLGRMIVTNEIMMWVIIVLNMSFMRHSE
jgi:hypothetical protein